MKIGAPYLPGKGWFYKNWEPIKRFLIFILSSVNFWFWWLLAELFLVWFEISPVGKLLDLWKRADIAVHGENPVGHNQPAKWYFINQSSKLYTINHCHSQTKMWHTINLWWDWFIGPQIAPKHNFLLFQSGMNFSYWKFSLDLERPSCDSCKPFSRSTISLCLYLKKKPKYQTEIYWTQN